MVYVILFNHLVYSLGASSPVHGNPFDLFLLLKGRPSDVDFNKNVFVDNFNGSSMMAGLLFRIIYE